MRLPWERRGTALCHCGAVLDRRWYGFIGHTRDGKRQHRDMARQFRQFLRMSTRRRNAYTATSGRRQP